MYQVIRKDALYTTYLVQIENKPYLISVSKNGELIDIKADIQIKEISAIEREFG